jgi:hypothetical protein
MHWYHKVSFLGHWGGSKWSPGVLPGGSMAPWTTSLVPEWASKAPLPASNSPRVSPHGSIGRLHVSVGSIHISRVSLHGSMNPWAASTAPEWVSMDLCAACRVSHMAPGWTCLLHNKPSLASMAPERSSMVLRWVLTSRTSHNGSRVSLHDYRSNHNSSREVFLLL